MNKYLLHSTLLCVFSEALALYGRGNGVDLKLFYFILPINFALLIFQQGNLKFPQYFGYIFGFLFLSCIFSIVFLYNSPTKGYFQLIGITFVSLYFYNFIRYFSQNGWFLVVIKTYLQYAYWVSILGIILFVVIFGLLGERSYRLHSIMAEPAHFAGIVLPAFFILMKNKKVNSIKFYVILFSLILTFSSVGYLGIFVSLFLYQENKFAFRNLFIFLIIYLSVTLAYVFVDDFRLRVDDTTQSYVSNDVEGANLSTYALISNMFVTEQVFQNNPVFGAGLGSHPESHKLYISKLPGQETFIDKGSNLANLNADDANSLFLRILSELGITGIVFVLLFLIKDYSNKNLFSSIISRALLIYFIYKLFREGNYFSPEMYFFVFLYYFNKIVNYSVDDFNQIVTSWISKKTLNIRLS